MKKAFVFIQVMLTLTILISCNNKSKTTKTGSDTSESVTRKGDTVTPTDNTGPANGLMGSMNAMMDRMKIVPMTGDFDVDFAKMMIEHHQGAIDMSQLEVNGGTDEKIKGIAQNIVVNQKKEIEELRKFLNNYKPSGMKHGEGELQKSMSGMENKMKTMPMSGNMDRDYVNMMISHHEGAIEMGKQQLANGMSEELKKMAQKMVTEQKSEIKQFKTWLDK